MFIILAVVIRAFVPVGFMPSATPEVTALTICSGFGERVVYLDADGVEHPAPSGDHPTSHSHECSFAVGSTSLTPAPVFIFETPQEITRADHMPQFAHAVFGVSVKNFDAQGPPAFLT